jgi:hypothetical protein
MKSLVDLAKRFLSQHKHRQEQQPEGSVQYTLPQPQHPGEEEYAPPQQSCAYTGQGQPHPSYPREPPHQPQNSQGSAATPPPVPGSGGRPTATRGVVAPNPYYTPPQGYRPQGDTPQAYPPGGSQAQEPYPPQGYLSQQQGGGGFLGSMGGGLLSGLAGGLASSMIGNAIFGDHGQTDTAPPREEIINVYEEAPQGVREPNAGVDPNTGGWDSAGGSWDNPGADWGDAGGGDTFGDDGGWV